MLVYVDIRQRGPKVCALIKIASVWERIASIRSTQVRCTQQVSYAYVKVR